MTQRGPALVRIALLSLVFGAFALALVQPSLAGTPDSPEVQDPANDVTVTQGTVPNPGPPGSTVLVPANFASIDIIKGYVQANNTTVKITLEMNGAISSDATAKYNATFSIVNGNTTTNRSVQRLGTTVTGPAGVAAAASGKFLNFTVPTASMGVVAGSNLTKLAISTRLMASQTIGGTAIPVSQEDQTGVDTAGPSTTPFTFNGPSAADLDSDTIPDACEEQYFNGTAAQNNASKDLDNDTLTIGEECALGTDPTKADSDGDGTNDKEDPFPTDATQGGTGSNSTSSTSRSGSGSSSGSRSSSGSSSRSGTGGDDEQSDEVRNLGDAVEKLKSDLDYLGTSAGGMLAVLILAILALAVRWSL